MRCSRELLEAEAQHGARRLTREALPPVGLGDPEAQLRAPVWVVERAQLDSADQPGAVAPLDREVDRPARLIDAPPARRSWSAHWRARTGGATRASCRRSPGVPASIARSSASSATNGRSRRRSVAMRGWIFSTARRVDGWLQLAHEDQNALGLTGRGHSQILERERGRSLAPSLRPISAARSRAECPGESPQRHPW